MSVSAFRPDFVPLSLAGAVVDPPVILCGQGLTIPEAMRVARHGTPVRLTSNAEVLSRVRASCAYMADAVDTGELIYGVTR